MSVKIKSLSTSYAMSSYLEDLKLITKISDYIIISDKEDIITWVNEGFTRITGFKLEQVIGKTAKSILRGQKTDYETMKRIDSNSKKRIAFRDQILNYSKDGKEIWLSLNVTPIFNKKNEFEKYICTQEFGHLSHGAFRRNRRAGHY